MVKLGFLLSVTALAACDVAPPPVYLSAGQLSGLYRATAKGVVDELVLRSDGTYKHTEVTATGARQVSMGPWSVIHREMGSGEIRTMVQLVDYRIEWLPVLKFAPQIATAKWTGSLGVEVHDSVVFIAVSPDDGLYYRKDEPLPPGQTGSRH